MAAIKNLEQRFLEKMDAIYGRYSTRDLAGGQKGAEPYRETKPNDSPLPNFGGPRTLSLDSIAADVVRLTKFSINNPFWYLDQQNLQSGNTFGETRVINPLFLIGNAQPYAHVKRPLSDASSIDLGGSEAGNHPGSTNNIGSAGRLQKSTSKNIVNLLKAGTNTTIWDSLARIAPPNRIFNTISMISNVIGDTGTLAVGQRPEMDMNGTGQFDSLYSIAAWKTAAYGGFTPTDTPTNNLARAGAALRQGSIRRAIAALNSLVRDTTQSATESPKLPGKRYFITSMGTNGDGGLPADRYMRGSTYSTNRYGYDQTDAFLRLGGHVANELTPNPAEELMMYPELSIHQIYTANEEIQLSLTNQGTWFTDLGPIVNHPPLVFTEPIITLEDIRRTSLISRNLANTNTAARHSQDATNAAQRSMARGPVAAQNVLQSQASQAMGRDVQARQADAAVNATVSGAPISSNPAEDRMKYPEFSLHQQYNTNTRLKSIQDSLDTQQAEWLTTLSITRINPARKNAGFKGGIPVNGSPVPITEGAKNPFTVATDDAGNRRYFFDDINLYPATRNSRGEGNMTREAMDATKAVHGTPLVDLYLYDYVNKVAIPFRANITAMNESTSPEFTDNFYIGRTERNIIYTGARRELSLSFMIYAFNAEELAGIWGKLNYLTSLCFPSRYANGFMVPPLIKMTLGDVYNNQPGYIKNLNYTVDPDTPWEISEPLQAPHGITVTMGYSIIEKVAQYSGKYAGYNPLHPSRYFVPLYNYGNPRLSQPPAPPPDARPRADERCVAPIVGTRNGITISQRAYDATRDNAGPPTPITVSQRRYNPRRDNAGPPSPRR